MVLLHEGRVLAADRPAELQAHFSGRLLDVSADTPRPPVDILAAVPGVSDVQVFGDRAHVRVSGASDEKVVGLIRAALERHGHQAISIRPIAASLEDVFIELIAGQR